MLVLFYYRFWNKLRLSFDIKTIFSYDLESETAAQTAKGKSRVAHTPTPAAAAAISRPMVTLDSRSSKVS